MRKITPPRAVTAPPKSMAAGSERSASHPNTRSRQTDRTSATSAPMLRAVARSATVTVSFSSLEASGKRSVELALTSRTPATDRTESAVNAKTRHDAAPRPKNISPIPRDLSFFVSGSDRTVDYFVSVITMQITEMALAGRPALVYWS